MYINHVWWLAPDDKNNKQGLIFVVLIHTNLYCDQTTLFQFTKTIVFCLKKLIYFIYGKWLVFLLKSFYSNVDIWRFSWSTTCFMLEIHKHYNNVSCVGASKGQTWSNIASELFKITSASWVLLVAQNFPHPWFI